MDENWITKLEPKNLLVNKVVNASLAAEAYISTVWRGGFLFEKLVLCRCVLNLSLLEFLRSSDCAVTLKAIFNGTHFLDTYLGVKFPLTSPRFVNFLLPVLPARV